LKGCDVGRRESFRRR